MQRKRIVHLISSLKIGGAESLLYDIIVGLGSEQYDHRVIYFHGGPNVERLRSLGIPVYQVRGLVGLYDPLFFWRAWRLIVRLRPDLIHTALWAANFVGRIIGRLQKIPTVCAVHLGVDLDGAVRNLLDHLTFRLATKVVAVSDGVAQSVKAKQGWIPAEKISVIRNGINAQFITDRAAQNPCDRKELGLDADHFVIGTVGRFVPRKNFTLLIESFAQLYSRHSKARLVLVGLGPQESLLRQRAQELGVEQEVIFVVGKPAYRYYPLFNCFVLPSAQEGLSIALLEAMCFGLPCVVTSQDGEHEVIASGYNGLIIKPHEPLALNQAIDQLILSYDNTIRMGKNAAQSLAIHFSFDRMITAYRNVFESVSKC